MRINNQIRLLKRTGILILFLGLCLFWNGCWKKAQDKVYRVGILCGLDYITDIADGFKTKMNELGYSEGENIVYDIRRTNFEPVKEEQILRKFVKEKVDLIFTFPTEVSMMAKTVVQGTNIPVLFSFANIEDTDLVESIREPGGNITGVRYPGPDIAVKRFEIMLELVPHAKHIWISYQRGYPIVASQLKALQPVAAQAGVILEEFPADDAAEIQAHLNERAAWKDIRMDAILFLAEPLAVTSEAFAVMGKFAFEHNVPIGGALISVDDFGSIFGVNVDIIATGKQAAVLADKILKGTEAGMIPVVSSESFFQIDYTTARQFGLDVSEGLLSSADEVIH